MKALLGKDGFDCRSHKLLQPKNSNKVSWYYEESRGLHIYTHDALVGIIPWRSLKASLGRYERAKLEKSKG